MGSRDSSGTIATTPQADESIRTLTRRFNFTVRRAQAAIFLERVIPRLIPPLCTTGLFITASWFGLWHAAPPVARMIGVITFAGAALASPFLAKTKSLFVTQRESLRRLDERLGDPTRPAQMLRDTVSAGSPQISRDVWNLHLDRLWTQWAGKFEVGPVRPAVKKPHLYGLYGTVLSVAISSAFAGGHHIDRIADAFNWSAPVVPIEAKAWITPPETFGEAPLYLNQNTKAGGDLAAHKNSAMTILVFDRDVPVTVNGTVLPVQKTTSTKNGDDIKSTYQYEIKQLGEGDVTVKIGSQISWTLRVSPDNAPTASIESLKTDLKEPGTLVLERRENDDYGVQESTLIIAPAKDKDQAATPLPSGALPTIQLK